MSYQVHKLATEIDGVHRIKLALTYNEQLVACAELGLDEPGQAELWSVYTEPQHRKQGYATLLVEAAIEATEAAGKPVIALSVNKENEAAIRLYCGLGFQAYGSRNDGFVDYCLKLENNVNPNE